MRRAYLTLASCFLLEATATGATVDCPIGAIGSISSESDGFVGRSEPRFGVEKNRSVATVSRAFVWWDLAGLPPGSIIEEAVVAYGFERLAWIEGECGVEIGPIRGDFKSWMVSSTKARFDSLDLPENERLFDEHFAKPIWSLANSMRLPFRCGRRVLLAGPRFGLAFKLKDEGRLAATVTLKAAAFGALTVKYNSPPLTGSPGEGDRVERNACLEFSWTDVRSANSRLRYRVQHSSDAAFTNEVVQSDWLTGGAWMPTKLPAAERVFWRVRLEDPENDENVSAWSPVVSFIYVREQR